MMNAVCCVIFSALCVRPFLRSIAGVTRSWVKLLPVPCPFRSLNRAWLSPSPVKAVMAVVLSVAAAQVAAVVMAAVVAVALAAAVAVNAKAKAVSVKAQPSLQRPRPHSAGALWIKEKQGPHPTLSLRERAYRL